ncbi:MAG: HDOD domain-containing protein [Verrucomicrobiota bacterium]
MDFEPEQHPDFKAQRTLEAIQESLGSRESRCLSNMVKLVQDLSSRALSLSVEELSNIIGSDTQVGAKVLSASNTLSYNPYGVPIKSVTQAIHLLGFDQISNLTLSLLLLENANEERNPKEQREIASQTLFSAYIARELARDMGIDRFQALACAALRNFGRLLMSSFMNVDYKAAGRLMETMSDEDAYRKVFGLTPLELGKHLLNSSQLPRSVQKCLEEVPEKVTGELRADPGSQLLLLSEASMQIVECSLNANLKSGDHTKAVLDKLHEFPGLHDYKESNVHSLFGRIQARLNDFSEEYGIDIAGTQTFKDWRLRSKLRDLDAHEAGLTEYPFEQTLEEPVEAVNLESSAGEGVLEADGENSRAPFEGITSPITEYLQGSHPDFKRAFDTLADYFFSIKQVEEVLIFTADREDPDQWYASWGKGVLFRGVGNRPIVKTSHRDLMGLVLQSGRDLFILDADVSKVQPLIPRWMQIPYRVKSVGIWPIHKGDEIYAVLLMAHIGEGFMNFGEHDIRIVQRLREEIENALSEAVVG